MKPYDPGKNYFGAEDHWSTELINKYPTCLDNAADSIAREIKEGINRAAYEHDKGYEGQRRAGFFGMLRDEYERYRIDRAFKKQMLRPINFNVDFLSDDEFLECTEFAYTAFDAVRVGGWLFFRKTN